LREHRCFQLYMGMRRDFRDGCASEDIGNIMYDSVAEESLATIIHNINGPQCVKELLHARQCAC